MRKLLKTLAVAEFYGGRGNATTYLDRTIFYLQAPMEILKEWCYTFFEVLDTFSVTQADLDSEKKSLLLEHDSQTNPTDDWLRALIAECIPEKSDHLIAPEQYLRELSLLDIEREFSKHFSRDNLKVLLCMQDPSMLMSDLNMVSLTRTQVETPTYSREQAHDQSGGVYFLKEYPRSSLLIKLHLQDGFSSKVIQKFRYLEDRIYSSPLQTLFLDNKAIVYYRTDLLTRELLTELFYNYTIDTHTHLIAKLNHWLTHRLCMCYENISLLTSLLLTDQEQLGGFRFMTELYEKLGREI